MQDGIVFWLTGLSGAGKTTIGKLLYEKLKKEKSNVVFLDGDILRGVFGSDLGYSLEYRHSGESLADLVEFGVIMEETKNPDMLIVNDGTFSLII